MAIPPPHVFINIDSARMRDAHTLEIHFAWPRCASAAALKTEWLGANQTDDGAWHVRFSLQELRTTRAQATCTGPVEKQQRLVDLRSILSKEMSFGVLEINDAGLYGYMKKLPSFEVPFDLR
jgi:hypothetical protein